ncbi:MAG: asparagine synthase (glutamine-hydrolyzing) [Elusimicrobia bacterium RIFOXYD2_FULL_34_15]|nr:MAG: asparagine synthase (glutamine-hydrolyzing) [Elusimicrobia bacterium RIFOXYD2_FULL_34_15]
MCGIIGLYNFGNSKPIEKHILQKMCDVIKHRGPDSEGIFFNNSTGLGIRRLAIIDLQTGNQPIHNEDKTLWLVLNGEIYNFLELREKLEKNHTFYTKTDTEVIIHLYEQYGEKCVEHLRGMFAFAIWDEKNKKLFVAKDRVGKKPLYYTSVNGSFIFASEIKSILEYLNKTPEIDLEAIDLYLTYQYIPSPKTIFKNIKSLLPAHTLTCDKNGNINTEKYWDLDFTRKTDLSFGEACEKTKSILTEATKLRMISDVPLGAFLSGGHDSSIIVGLMSRLSTQPVKTFSIGFDEAEFSELKYAKIVANHFKTDHHEFIVKANFIDILPKLAWHYGQPYADSSALPSYFVSNETRKHVTVALNGDGGDETFGGYLRYKAMKGSMFFSFPFQMLGSNLTKKIASFIPYSEEKRFFRYMKRMISALSNSPELRNLQWHYYFSNEAKEKLYTNSMKQNFNNNTYKYLAGIFKNAPANNTMDRTFYTDIKAYLPECLLVKMDIASMANSLEARSPFLDHKVMEFSASLPPSWKVHGLTTKYILKKTFNNFLPKEIINRKKMGFGIPVGKWFRNEWKNYFIETVMSKKALERGYFKKESLEQLFKEHQESKRDNGYRLWALLMLELWHRVYVDKSV